MAAAIGPPPQIYQRASVPPEEALHDAIVTRNLPLVKHILEEREGIANTLYKGVISPLEWAASVGDPEIIKALLEKGADPRYFNGHRSALHSALAYPCENTRERKEAVLTSDSFKEMLTLLLDAGADVNLKDFKGTAPLHLAVNMKAPEEILRILIDAEADPDTVSDEGWTTALTSAFFHRKIDDYSKEIKFLISVANVNACAPLQAYDSIGSCYFTPTPLNLAISKGTDEMIRMLVMRGAILTPETESLAKSRGKLEILQAAMKGREIRLALIRFRTANDKAPPGERLKYSLYHPLKDGVGDEATSGSASSAMPPS